MRGDLDGGVAGPRSDRAECPALIPDGVGPSGSQLGDAIWQRVGGDVDVGIDSVSQQQVSDQSANKKEPVARGNEPFRQLSDSFGQVLAVFGVERCGPQLVAVPPVGGKRARTRRSGRGLSHAAEGTKWPLHDLRQHDPPRQRLYSAPRQRHGPPRALERPARLDHYAWFGPQQSPAYTARKAGPAGAVVGDCRGACCGWRLTVP